MKIDKQAVYTLCRHFGVPVVHTEYTGKHLAQVEEMRKVVGKGPIWADGVLWVPPSTEPEALLHELGHWFEATPEQRKEFNWGLSIPGADGREGDIREGVATDIAHALLAAAEAMRVELIYARQGL